MRRIILLITLILTVAGRPAEALTIRDIVELSKAGLGEDVLLALIEVDRQVFAIDRDTIRSLKQSGVSERVIVAMIRSGRALEAAPAVADVPQAREPEPSRLEPAPQVVVIDHEPRVEVREVPVPVYVMPYRTRSTYVTRGHGTTLSTAPNTGSAYYVGQVPQPVARPTPPEYWGWGGKLRPDAWKTPEPERRGHRDRREQ